MIDFNSIIANDPANVSARDIFRTLSKTVNESQNDASICKGFFYRSLMVQAANFLAQVIVGSADEYYKGLVKTTDIENAPDDYDRHVKQAEIERLVGNIAQVIATRIDELRRSAK